MANHPNRGRRKPSDNPPPELIREAMERIGHNIDQMRSDLNVSRSAVESWLATTKPKRRPMHPEMFSRYLSKNGLIEADQDWKDL